MTNVLGYRICRNPACEAPTPDQVAHSTGGLCLGCALGGLNDRLEQVQIEIDGGIYVANGAPNPKSARNRRQKERRKGDPRVKRRRHNAEKARQAAFKRLAKAAPELFALIYADERQKRGLTPISTHRALQIKAGELGWATLDALAFYRALASQEQAPNDPHDPTPDADQAR